MAGTLDLDAVILGGGIAGLWTLRALCDSGHQAILIERSALGDGQTLWSQGIIHGGLKYTLTGRMNRSARAIREMPARWSDCLAGRAEPNLSAAGIRVPHCHLWRTTSLRSRAGMIGARFGLRVRPVTLRPEQRPEVLRRCAGSVARLDEIVIDPARVLEALAAPVRDHLIQASDPLISNPSASDGAVQIELERSQGARLALRTRALIIAAGAGAGPIRERLGLDAGRMQIRPLHMVMVRGTLRPLNGHCVDGARTRVTITSAVDETGRTVWQVGGEVAERGVGMEQSELIGMARRELLAVIPGLDLSGCEWATYRADRAEGRAPGGARPEDVVVVREGPVISAWPTKLALAPRLADRIVSMIDDPQGIAADPSLLESLPRPGVASPPWDRTGDWVPDEQAARVG